MTALDHLSALNAAGVSIWLDDLSRELLQSGRLRSLIEERHVVGVTTNPTIFTNSIIASDAYSEQIRTLAGQGADVEGIVRELTKADVTAAADLLNDIYVASGRVDGRVSIEVDPRLAHDAERTVEQAQQLWSEIDRPNLMIKIPATEEGLEAITRTLAAGISVNVTLIFAPARYRQVVEAFFSGLESAQANGFDLSEISSVASFFVSRVDTAIDAQLGVLDCSDASDLLGLAGVANAQLAYGAYRELFSSPRWAALAEAGAMVQRPLWASTGVKNPAYSSTLYVDALAAPGTVNTMPPQTLAAAEAHAAPTRESLDSPQIQAAARVVFAQLDELGIDVDDVYLSLEREGVGKFIRSWQELLEAVAMRLDDGLSI
jgi:transaldolase